MGSTAERAPTVRSFAFTERDGASTLRKLLETREVVTPYRCQFTHRTVRSPSWKLINPEKHCSPERIEPIKVAFKVLTRWIEHVNTIMINLAKNKFIYALVLSHYGPNPFV